MEILEPHNLSPVGMPSYAANVLPGMSVSSLGN